MDSATKHLLHALYANPRDPDALAEIRGHFIKQKQFPALAKVLEWWSAKASSSQQAAEALFEAAELLDRGKPDPTQVVALLEKALEYDPSFNSASIKLETLYRAQGEEEKAQRLLDKRIDRISLIEALDDVFASEQEKRISYRSQPSDRFRESRSDQQSFRVPASPRVPDFEIPASERHAESFDTSDDLNGQGDGFDERPTSQRRVSASGMPYTSEVRGSFGGELETQTFTSTRSSRPPSGLVAKQIARAVDSRVVPSLDDDDDDNDDEDRFYRSYSGRAPDNGGSAAPDYEFDEPVTDITRERFVPEDDDGEHWVDQQTEPDHDAHETAPVYGETEVAYRVLATEPLLNATEIDSAQPTVEIDVIWGDDNVLHVEHLSPPRAFYVGDGKSVDFLIGCETLGTDRIPVLVETESGIAVAIPPGATGEVAIDDQVTTFETLYENGLLQPCRELTGAYQFVLPEKSTAFVGYCGFIFIIRRDVGAKSVGKDRKRGFRFADQTWNLLVAGIVLLMLLCFAFRPPESTMLSLEALNADTRLASYLIEPPEFEEEAIPEWLEEQADADEDEEQAEPEEAEHKPDKPVKSSARRRRRSSPSNGERASRLLSTLASTGSNGGQTLNKVVAKLGSAGGGSSANSFSLSNALAGLNGVGGINVGGSGSGTGTGFGIGSAGGEAAAKSVGKLGGRGGGGRKSVRGKVRALSLGSRVSGSLTPGQVLKVINQHMAKIQQCYERGLTRNPTLAGQVKFDWTVTPNGGVSSLRQASSTLGDIQVTKCIANSISRMHFPKPKGGSVTISFPFIFRRAQ